MLTLSKPISAGQAQAYHRSEFANAKENYYTEGERVRGVWQGQLAERWNLKGEVSLQTVSLACLGIWPYVPEFLRMATWGLAVICLFPGNFLGGWIIEKIFWSSHISLTAISVLSGAAAIVLDAAVWIFVLTTFRVVFRFGHKVPGPTRDRI